MTDKMLKVLQELPCLLGANTSHTEKKTIGHRDILSDMIYLVSVNSVMHGHFSFC